MSWNEACVVLYLDGEKSTVNKILGARQLPLIWEWTLHGHRPGRGSCKAGSERAAAAQ